MRFKDLFTRTNLLITFIVMIILFVLYSNRSVVNDLTKNVEIRWIWFPVILIIVTVAIILGKFFFRKKND